MTPYDFIVEEVHRQGFPRGTPEHARRVGWMTEAWEYAEENQSYIAHPSLVEKLGRMVEPERNYGGYRTTEVSAGGRPCPPAHDIHVLMKFWRGMYTYADSANMYLTFELIHPFLDGNGRVGKIIYNLLEGTMDDPTFPPDFFGFGVP